MDSEEDSQDERGFGSDGFGGADPHVKVCRTAAGPAQLHGSPYGENCSTVGIAGLWRRYIQFLPSLWFPAFRFWRHCVCLHMESHRSSHVPAQDIDTSKTAALREGVSSWECPETMSLIWKAMNLVDGSFGAWGLMTDQHRVLYNCYITPSLYNTGENGYNSRQNGYSSRQNGYSRCYIAMSTCYITVISHLRYITVI